MDVRFRPLPEWPYPPTKNRRSKWAFKAGWQNTLDLLQHELGLLRARDVIIGAGFREQDLRLDGLPRSNAQTPEFPGVEVSFDTPTHGRLVYGTDTCELWQHNIRSIALGLEALRAVDRYGITRRGEQYAGFRALPAGGETTGGPTTRADAWAYLCGVVEAPIGTDMSIDQVARAALKRTHPDAGGDPATFRLVQEARRILEGGSA
jgi:hypothetical protein